MNLVAQALLDSPVGRIAIFDNGKHLTAIDIFPGDINYRQDNTTNLTQHIVEQLRAYFSKSASKACDLSEIPIKPKGTEFQQSVWQLMQAIPCGSSWTYGEMASQLETSPRAIGGACRRNPIPIVVPCHRVVAASGIGGYSGQWKAGKRVDVKQWLLAHEKQRLIST
ncbi:hypothetical protein C2869_16895 [Saccharobesus litoralis]|uniref:methylated-DNA--[protein]-cysteine S-methyltransferase n=1 Tax=Saccharobesus litoralis TaxID=2172099 RepID=A0A2S0VUW2_9ALTE|nr:methylated-DNA--[protein]-cysteine S-methyltransferase [Saccharobesus litoralis]AWB67998.1 hypothetical protein C2869_16895 [Saccharobesus litoralis]